jgi:hypothetical protein
MTEYVSAAHGGVDDAASTNRAGLLVVLAQARSVLMAIGTEDPLL